MPSVHAHAHDDDTGSSNTSETPAGERPISLADIDRVLQESAGVAESTGVSPVRAWRDALTLALESLGYARVILAADVGILRHSMATEGPDDQSVVDDLPSIVTAVTWGEEWSSTEDPPPGAELDLSVVARSDPLLSAHREMARTDLSSPEDVARTMHAPRGAARRPHRTTDRGRGSPGADPGHDRPAVQRRCRPDPQLAGLSCCELLRIS